MTRRFALAAALAFGVLAPAAAQPPTLRQTVVVTAAATPVELGSVTRTLTVITREQLASLPVQSVADALRLLSSVDVRARGGRGVQTDFAIRGATFGQMLVLVDGVRLNDAQSGHHNGDIPVPLDAVERIEVLYGPGSSLFGADAFGGTINIVTRREILRPSLRLEGGSFGLAAGRGAAGFERGLLRQTVAVSAERSSGFMYDRDFATVAAHARTLVGADSGVSVSFLRKEFGANNFYGGNAPSREWTNQLLFAADHRLGAARAWIFDAGASYRTHGDRFLFDQERPLLSDNRHRTHAALATLTASTQTLRGASIAVGVEGGRDWIRSSNLGDHGISRLGAFAEWRQAFGARTQLDTAVRVDRYSEFGTSVSPAAGIGWWAAGPIRLRASAGRAFRVPTFTERFYSDPANLASPDVGPETAWAGEGGVDLFLDSGWRVGATAFGRVDDEVIDWLRPTVADRWRTFNVRRVTTSGIELDVSRTFAGGAFLRAQYTGLSLDADEVQQLSKYVLDYAPRSLTAAGLLPLPRGLHLAPRLEYRRRSRSSGGDDYVLLDLRVGARLGRGLDLFAEGTNLFDASYQEIAGVQMPGAAVAAGVAWSR